MNLVPVKPKSGDRIHARREVVRSKTLCGRAMARGWKDAPDHKPSCSACADVVARFHDEDEDTFGHYYLNGDE